MKKEIIVEHANKTVYRVDDEVVKLFKPGHAKAELFNEAWIHAHVETAGIPVPEVRAVRCLDGRWALVQEYIEGQTLQQMMDEKPRQYKKLIDRLIDIQLEVSSHKVPQLNNTLDKMAKKINTLKEIDASTRYELLQRVQGMSRHTKLCHGDFVPSNVIILKDGRYKILDWAHATQGNAGADAAITYLRFCLTDEKLAEYYLKSYSLKADMAIQYIQQWMPIVAAAQLTKHIPEEKDLLMKWISVVEYM